MIITIDGVSGVGKGTVARLLAMHYGFPYMDTGLLFRRVAYLVVSSNLDPDKEADVLKAVEALQTTEEMPFSCFRTEEISQVASRISTHRAFREKLLDIKRHFAATEENTIFDGRDMGTVVFPEADKKFFLTASAQVRAERRLKDFQIQGIQCDFQDILHNIQERDFRDATRAVAPTKPASDAFVVDTTFLSIEEVFQKCVSFIEQ